MKRATFLGTLALVALVAAGYGLYQFGMNHGMSMTASAPPQKPDEGRRVLYWHDPMVPGKKFDKPGKSPFMDMQLVPVYAEDAASGEGGVRIDPRAQQNLGIRTAEVTLGVIQNAVEAIGNVAYNERDVAVVQARSNGFVERLLVRAPLDPVRRGQPLAELYVPDWVAAQEEYLTVSRMSRAPAGLLEGARQRMRLAGMSDTQIAAVEKEAKVQPRLTVTSPLDGVVTELSAREGMTVSTGAPLFRVNGVDTVWVNAEIPEAVAHQVRPGLTADVTTSAYPEKAFKGRVTAILPEVNSATRTLKARIEVANPERLLTPGMFARTRFAPATTDNVLVVPSQSVIRTGTRNVVMVAKAEGRFEPVEVELGAEAAGQSEIRKGLAAGDKVVVSGQFLIDSESSLKGVEVRQQGAPTNTPPAAPAQAHKGEGKVERIDKDEVTLSHKPIPSLQWPAMTMSFKPPPAGLPPDVRVGDEVSFETAQLPGGQFGITKITKRGGAPK